MLIQLIQTASTKLPEDFEVKTWDKLQLAIRAVHEKQAIAVGEEELYKVCLFFVLLPKREIIHKLMQILQATENLCTHKLGGNLYKRIQAECETHVRLQLAKLFEVV